MSLSFFSVFRWSSMISRSWVNKPQLWKSALTDPNSLSNSWFLACNLTFLLEVQNLSVAKIAVRATQGCCSSYSWHYLWLQSDCNSINQQLDLRPRQRASAFESELESVIVVASSNKTSNKNLSQKSTKNCLKSDEKKQNCKVGAQKHSRNKARQNSYPWHEKTTHAQEVTFSPSACLLRLLESAND